MTGKITVGTIQDTAGTTVASTFVTNGVAKMWAQFESSTNTIEGSLNVSSLTDHGTGDFSFPVTNNFSGDGTFSATYGGNVTSGGSLNYATGYNFNRVPTASEMRWAQENSNGGAYDNAGYGNHISVHGDLA
jgi:hypothetical protein